MGAESTNEGAVVVERDGAVGIIRLNRPEVGNAIDLATADAFDGAVWELTSDAGISAIVLCGTGPRFCVGGDLGAFRSAGTGLPGLLRELAERAHDGIARLVESEAPTVVAVHGAAAGVGVSLVAACDLVVAERSAFFTTAYSAIGLTPDGGATLTLPRAVGERRARELLLTNRRLGAEEAHAWGLVTEVVDDGEALPRALAVARAVGEVPRSVVGGIKRLIERGRTTTLREQLELEADSIATAGALAAERLASGSSRTRPQPSGG